MPRIARRRGAQPWELIDYSCQGHKGAVCPRDTRLPHPGFVFARLPVRQQQAGMAGKHSVSQYQIPPGDPPQEEANIVSMAPNGPPSRSLGDTARLVLTYVSRDAC